MSGGEIQVLTTIIITGGGIVTAYITYVLARRRREARPKDRMETIFDGYEKLIRQQQSEIDRKSEVIQSLQNIVDRLEKELGHTRQLLNQARDDLVTSRKHSDELKLQLTNMKQQYRNGAA